MNTTRNHTKSPSKKTPEVQVPKPVTLDSIKEAAGITKNTSSASEPLRIIRAAIRRVERADLLELAEKYYQRPILDLKGQPPCVVSFAASRRSELAKNYCRHAGHGRRLDWPPGASLSPSRSSSPEDGKILASALASEPDFATPQTTMNSPTEQNDGSFPEVIAEFIPIPLIVESLSACLNATTTSRNGTTVPDCRTRLETAKLILGYMIGTPIPSKEVIPLKEDSQDARSFEDLLMQSPAMLREVKETLARVEARKAAIDV